jgi:hypothetical protein
LPTTTQKLLSPIKTRLRLLILKIAETTILDAFDSEGILEKLADKRMAGLGLA